MTLPTLLRRAAGAALMLTSGLAAAHPGHDDVASPAHLWPLLALLAVAALAGTGATAGGRRLWRAALPALVAAGGVAASALLVLWHV
ncbi:MAG: hypothetical protein H6932_18310 [Burkholderiaceae bacterium]|nr:hypothetical protein [Burkholderiaceae bacterium]